jgi:hypothetical protein
MYGPGDETNKLCVLGKGESMISVVALACAAVIARSECTEQNAIDVIQVSDATDDLSCMRDSVMTLASLAIRAGPDKYWKVVCAAPIKREPILVGQREDGVDIHEPAGTYGGHSNGSGSGFACCLSAIARHSPRRGPRRSYRPRRRTRHAVPLHEP